MACHAVLADGSAPITWAAVFGHFYAYAPKKLRILHRPVHDETQAPAGMCLKPSSGRMPIWCGGRYSIADMAIWAWYGSFAGPALQRGRVLDVETYSHVDGLAEKRIGRAPSRSARSQWFNRALASRIATAYERRRAQRCRLRTPNKTDAPES